MRKLVNTSQLEVEDIHNHMKYIMPENKIDKTVFRYLDIDLKGLEKGKPKYFKGYVFVYHDKEDGILGYENNCTLYIYYRLIDDISSYFGLDRNDSKSIISRWASDRYQLEVNNTKIAYDMRLHVG